MGSRRPRRITNAARHRRARKRENARRWKLGPERPTRESREPTKEEIDEVRKFNADACAAGYQLINGVSLRASRGIRKALATFGLPERHIAAVDTVGEHIYVTPESQAAVDALQAAQKLYSCSLPGLARRAKRKPEVWGEFCAAFKLGANVDDMKQILEQLWKRDK